MNGRTTDWPAPAAPILAALVLVLSASARAAGPAPVPVDPGAVLVVDAGSSGTRLFLIRYERLGGRCETRGVARVTKNELGMAGQDDGALGRFLDEALAARPELAALPVRIVGTGGFRNLDKSDGQTCGAECAGKRDRIKASLAKSHPNARLHVASGVEEGKLDWVAVAARTGGDRHAVVDVGGSTMELAVRVGGRLESVMANVGNAALRGRVPACAPPGDFDACVAGVEALLNAEASAIYGRKLEPGAPVLALGGGWTALPRLAADFLSYAPLNFSPALELDKIERLGRLLCPKRADELLATGKVLPEHAPQICGQLALELLLARRLKVSGIEAFGVEVGAAFAELDGYRGSGPACPNLAELSR